MTESDWLTSSDPAAMLRYIRGQASITTAMRPNPYPLPDRKLRLFACACRRQYPNYDWVAGNGWYEDENGLPSPMREPEPAEWWGRLFLDDRNKSTLFANLLREAFGNPWRPLQLRHYRRLPNLDGGTMIDMSYPCWLTDAVLRLAQAAYDERAGHECERCAKDRGPSLHPARQLRCALCKGTGTISTGQLCPDRLAVLADALEEAGCNEEQLLWHLRDLEPCPWCLIGSHGMEQACGGRGYGKHQDGRVHGLIKLRSPHYRGCWALDVILGKG